MVSYLLVIMLMAHLSWVVGVAGMNIGGLTHEVGSPGSFNDPVASLPEDTNTDSRKRFEYPIIGESIQGHVHTETVYVTLTTTVRVFGTPKLTAPLEVATEPFATTTVATDLAQPLVDSTSLAPTFITSPRPTPTVCGEHEDFLLNFDELPRYSGGEDGFSSPYPPVFNPYRHFFFSGGWGYLHERNSPVSPKSLPHVAIYEAGENDSFDTGSPYAGLLAGGSFGAGPRAYDDVFWFNAKSFYFGCNNGSNDGPCIITVTGSKYSPEVRAEYPSVSKTFTIDACPDDEVCVLQQIELPEDMEGLSSLGFEVTVLDSPVTWYIDDVEMSWFNNTCFAGLKRLSSR